MCLDDRAQLGSRAGPMRLVPVLVPLVWLFSCGPTRGDHLDGGSGGGGASGAGGGTAGSGGNGDATGGGSSSTGGGSAAGGGTAAGGGAALPDGGYPVKHVIVIVKENHTFDNYFGTFPGAEGTTTYTLSDGGTKSCGHAPMRMPRDMDHDHDPALTDWAQGAMNGWDLVSGSNDNNDGLAYQQYHEADIPSYWAYARTFTLADHFFSEVLGPSFPGHLSVLTAQAGWALGNPDTQYTHPYWGCDQDSSTRVPVQDQLTCTTKQVFPCFDIPSLPDVLPAGVDWKFYGSNFYVFPEIWSMFNAVSSIRNGPGWAKVVKADQFDSDIDQHKLPEVVFLVNQDFADEHPLVGTVCDGENWTVQRVNKLMGSDYWASSVIIFTMDDFGGWYDHVPPPRHYGCDPAKPYGLGFRLPTIIMSPYAKPGFVFKEVAEHASIARFIEKIFGSTKTLHSMDPAAQDEQANDLMNAFDWNQQPLPPLMRQTRTCL